jgi:outer membrane biosynthesis protein TonB
MRLHHGLALTLWLTSLASAAASANQEPAGAPIHADQEPESAAHGQTVQPAQVPDEPGGAPSPAASPETEDTKPAANAPGAEPKPAVEPENKPAPPANAARKRRKHSSRAVPGSPRKVVVREGGASEPAAQIAPGMSPAEAVHQRQNAERWLGSTDEQLRQLSTRTLDARQQETVGQIHNYMDGARSALKEGDVGRASTLAQKAHLLSDDLIKH